VGRKGFVRGPEDIGIIIDDDDGVAAAAVDLVALGGAGSVDVGVVEGTVVVVVVVIVGSVGAAAEGRGAWRIEDDIPVVDVDAAAAAIAASCFTLPVIKKIVSLNPCTSPTKI
jgi:hypothetical protein